MEDEPDFFGAAETPEAPRPGGLLSPFLRHDGHGDKAASLALTVPGMAGIAAPALGVTCRSCVFWAGAAGDKRDSWGDLRPAACRKYEQLTPARSRKTAKDRQLPASNCACEYFELNPRPPAMGRNG
jgi:hypothetical protein